MNKKRYGEKTEITVSIEGKSAVITGFTDTGNALLDPITLYPVVVARYEALKEMLPDEICEFLKEGSNLNCNINRRYLSKIRLIPYSGVGSSDILKGFCPDFIIVKDEKIKDVVIAVTYDKLSSDDEFDAILNPLM